jgi:hypothetical protein
MAVVHEDFEPLAVLLALNHFRSKIRKRTRSKVAAGDVEAILEVMEAEAKEQGRSMAEIGRDMLADLDRWNEVPRERWQDASPIKSYFEKREYRIGPRDVPGATRVKKCASNDNQKGSADSDTIELVDQAIGNTCHTTELEIGGSAREVRSGSDVEEKSASLFPRRDRVTTVANPSYPRGVQWPRRVR